MSKQRKSFLKIKLASTWLTNTQKDINQLRISGEVIDEITPLRNKLNNVKEFQQKPKKIGVC